MFKDTLKELKDEAIREIRAELSTLTAEEAEFLETLSLAGLIVLHERICEQLDLTFAQAKKSVDGEDIPLV